MTQKFIQNQIVICDVESPVNNPHAYPWKKGESLLYLGEVVQMPGHCIVVNRKGKIFWGWHTDNFRYPTENEI